MMKQVQTMGPRGGGLAFVDVSAGDGERERGAVKDFSRDAAFGAFKTRIAALSVSERARFDPEGWVVSGGGAAGGEQQWAPKLAALERG